MVRSPIVSAGTARTQLFRLIDEVAESHVPVQMIGKRNAAVLVSAEDWSAIQETLFLVSIPGMRKSILKNMKTPHTKMSKSLKW